MGHAVVSCDVDDGFVAHHRAVERQGERLEGRVRADAAEDVARADAGVGRADRGDVVQPRAVRQIGLDHGVLARARHARLDQREFGARVQLQDVVQDDVGRLVAAAVDDVDRARDLGRDVDRQAVHRNGGVQGREGTHDRRLPGGFQRAVAAGDPVGGLRVGGRQRLDPHAVGLQRVRGGGVEHAVHEHQPQPVERVEHLRLLARDGDGGGGVGVQGPGIGVAPVFVAGLRQAGRDQPLHRVAARAGRAAVLRRLQRGQARRGRGLGAAHHVGGLDAGRRRAGGVVAAAGGGVGHHAPSARMPA